MASQTKKIDTSKKALADRLDQSQIAALAYELWQARGCPVGSPEDDWFRAEQELKAHPPRAASGI